MDLTGLGNVLVNLYLGMRKDKELQEWLRLFTSMLLSAVIAFCGTAGPALAKGVAPAVAIGVGLTAVAACTLGLCLRSPQTRSLMIEVPQSIVKEVEEHPDDVTIAGKDAEKR